MQRDLVTVDFETEVIGHRPAAYPPVPGAVSIKINGKRPKYYAWKHDNGNNCTKAQGRAALKAVWDQELLFHNSGFDIEVGRVHMGLKRPKHFHDTLFLAFLYDPMSPVLQLKPLANELLDIPPTEKDEVSDWLTSRGYEDYDILRAPVKLAGPYGNGDTDRTYGLFNSLMPAIEQMGMRDAYDCERNVMYTVLDMEDHGVHIDYFKLEEDTCKFERSLDRCVRHLKRELGDINFGSGKQLANALLEKGCVDVNNWPLTRKGTQYSTKVDVLQEVVTDTKLANSLWRHSKFNHMLNSFCYPWLERMESYSRARLWPQFNQVRGRDDWRMSGARSGRFSSTNPNFQQLNRDPGDPHLPFMRKYLLPEDGHVLLGRDFDQQELRILAHYEGNILKDMYDDNPRLDMHDLIKQFMEEATGEKLDRAYIKRLNFGTIYGMGYELFAKMEKIKDLEYAAYLHRLHKRRFPGLQDINRELRILSRNGDPIATRNGRLYFPTPGKEYVQLNRLIQGSAADHTKFVMPLIAEAIAPFGASILLTVHDEILVTCPRQHAKQCMAAFTAAMETTFFDIPTPTDGKIGDTWGTMIPEKKWVH